MTCKCHPQAKLWVRLYNYSVITSTMFPVKIIATWGDYLILFRLGRTMCFTECFPGVIRIQQKQQDLTEE